MRYVSYSQGRAHTTDLHNFGSVDGGAGPDDPGGGLPGDRINQTHSLPILHGTDVGQNR